MHGGAMDKIIVLVGPTASGKTSLSIRLAQELGGEIISADSMQIYRHMDIGTAKPDAGERAGIPHHLIDVVMPDVQFSVAHYQSMAHTAIQEVLSKGKLPIIVGGTGLYINSLVHNIHFSDTVSDRMLRDSLGEEARLHGNQHVYDMLMEMDPDSAKNLHVNDLKRIIRAIEVFQHTKKSITYHRQVSRLQPPIFDYRIIGLQMSRDRLYGRIDQRVDLMMEKGLLEEVRALKAMGFDRKSPAMQGIGYKELLAYFRGLVTLEEAIRLIKTGSRHYAKRQMTWFKRLDGVHWMDLDHCSDEGGVVCEIKKVFV